MKIVRKLILLTVFALSVSFNTIVFAASGSSSGTVTLRPSETSVEAGKPFTVTVSQECSDGIIGFEANLDYDTSVFDLGSVNAEGSWMYLGEGTRLDAMANDDIKSGDVLTLNFTVKSGAKSTNSQIKVTGIKLYKTYDETVSVSNKTVDIKVGAGSGDVTGVTLSKIAVTSNPRKTTYTEGEKFDKTGMVVTATYSDNSTKEVTDYIYSPSEALKTSDRAITISYTEGGVTRTATQAITVNSVGAEAPEDTSTPDTPKAGESSTAGTQDSKNSAETADNTKAGTTLPKTGTGYILVFVVAAVIVGVVLYRKCVKYKDIK